MALQNSAQKSAGEQERQADMDRSISADLACRVQQVIPTGTLFAAALDRLNRKSLVTLFQELAQKLDDHDRRLVVAGEALAAHERRARRACLLCLLLALLLTGLCFFLGLYTMRRMAPVQCVSACPSASAAGGSAQANTAAPASALVEAPASASASASASAPASAMPIVVPPRSESAQAAMTLAQIKAEPETAPLAISGYKLQPGTMESEILSFLRRPGPRMSHTFTMDRLNYPPNSHEVNAEGKEQIFLLAKILLAYPAVRIEIRGHNDSTESELYTGPNPLAGYSLSQLRASCVLQRLQGLRVPGERMRLRGLGATQPVAEDRSAEGRQHNRRVEIVLLP